MKKHIYMVWISLLIILCMAVSFAEPLPAEGAFSDPDAYLAYRMSQAADDGQAAFACNRTGTGKPQHFTRLAEGISLREGKRRANARETARARPDHDALDAVKVEFIHPPTISA